MKRVLYVFLLNKQTILRLYYIILVSSIVVKNISAPTFSIFIIIVIRKQVSLTPSAYYRHRMRIGCLYNILCEFPEISTYAINIRIIIYTYLEQPALELERNLKGDA